MKKRILNFLLGSSLLISSGLAFSENCYILSKDGESYSRTPEQLCVSGAGVKEDEEKQDPFSVMPGEAPKRSAKITLSHGLWDKEEVASFNFELVDQMRCGPDCNGNVYGIENPSNSIFNQLEIKFDGRLTLGKNGKEVETGTVSIGKNTFHYRKI